MYNYDVEKQRIFTEENQKDFLEVQDEVYRLLNLAGAFQMFKPLKRITGDSFLMMAYIDRLVELGEIREITPENVAGQHRVFVRADECPPVLYRDKKE